MVFFVDIRLIFYDFFNIIAVINVHIGDGPVSLGKHVAPHSRLKVTAATSMGKSASSVAIRATLRLSSPAWLAHPKIASSMFLASRPEASSMISLNILTIPRQTLETWKHWLPEGFRYTDWIPNGRPRCVEPFVEFFRFHCIRSTPN